MLRASEFEPTGILTDIMFLVVIVCYIKDNWHKK